MKIRIAKKIMMFNENAKINKHQQKRFKELRPSFVNKHGNRVFPSYHDIDIVRRAGNKLRRWLKSERSMTTRISKQGTYNVGTDFGFGDDITVEHVMTKDKDGKIIVVSSKINVKLTRNETI